MDYQKTFALVVNLNTIQMLLSLAANLDEPLHQLDIKNAFLNDNLEEEVDMEIPSGFQTSYGNRKACKFFKSLYGLKQSPWLWFGKFSKSVDGHSFIQCQANHTIFMKQSLENKLVVLIIYVDDVILTRDYSEELLKIKGMLAEELEVKGLGPL